MKNLLKVALVSLGMVSMVSCSDDDKNEMPTTPGIETNFVNAEGVATDVTLTWNKSEDPDGDEVTYDVYIGESETLTDADIKSKAQKTNSYKANLKGHTQYFWKVVAYDTEGGVAEGDVNKFTTVNAVPAKPEITGQVEELVSDDLTMIVKWSTSEDADGDAVVYDLYVTKNDEFADADLVKADIVGTEYRITALEGYTDYKIKVVSKDEFGGKIDSDIVEYTTQMIDGEIYVREGTFVDSRDNHEYKTVEINGTTWLAENFAYLPFFTDPDADEKKCSVYGKPIVGAIGQSDFVMPTIEEAKAHENYAKYGVMYSAAILDDIAPEGWHVATDEEWQELEKLSGMLESDAEFTGYRGNTLHKFLSTDAGWTNEPAPTDEFKLNIKPGGYNKVLEDKGEGAYTYFWTNSSMQNMFGKKYWNRAFSGTKTGVNRGNTKSSTYRMYVRLVKDK
ncbi:FISUMP domain-containing protein [Marinifilum breve]|nr:FISUMP domain-containing protein [Marinifilum breve]